MKFRFIFVLGMILGLLLCGCHREENGRENRPADVEPTASYDWMAGESPVPNKRIGVERFDVSDGYIAIAPSGVYCIRDVETAKTISSTFLYYMDNQADKLVPLCGRADCTHNNADCNAYVFSGSKLSYYKGYLYVMSGDFSEEKCELIRMEPDGSNHVTELDLLDFAKKHGGDFANLNIMTDGYFLFTVSRWSEPVELPDGSMGLNVESVESYYYALDGSMDEPKVQQSSGLMYNCGEVLLCYSLETRHGGQCGSVWEWEPAGDTMTYLADHPGTPSYFDSESGYYFRSGKVVRYDCATSAEEVLFETGLMGDYVAIPYADCIVVADYDETSQKPDNTIYIYNWAYELVDMVELNFDHPKISTAVAIVAETAERFLLSSQTSGEPQYYIEKSELGTGNAVVHEFQRN